MSDIRSLLNTLDSIKESRQKGQWPELDSIVDKYAKPGMNLEDLSKLEQEARDAEPPDLDDEESSGLGGFFKSLGRKGKQLVSTEDFRVKYAIANAAEKLRLPGLYNAKGSRFYYYDEGDQFGNNGNDAGYKATSRSNRSDAVRINDAGLLPPSVAERFDLEPKGTDLDARARQDDEVGTEEPPQSSSELDTDSRDNAPANDGKLRFKDGSTFYRNRDSQIELNKRLAKMIRRMNELLRKMNESIPNSLKGYLSESDRARILSEALSSSEKQELKEIIENLQAVIDFKDDQGPLISETNLQLLKDRIARIPASVMQELTGPETTAPAQEPTAGPDDGTRGSEEPEPEAQRASDASGDADATVDPGEKPAASSLEAFAKSGKGGLANDPDEVDAITELQQYLTDLGFDPNGVDGKYGPGTIKGVKAFQEWMGAKVDGDAGPETIGVIIKLRSIRWGEGGSKDFAEWRRTMTRMEQLIGKAGNATESADMNSMSSILEMFRRLDEALSDSEAEELKAIIDELQSAYEDAEFQQVLPPNVQKRFSNNMRAGQGVLKDMGVGDQDAEQGADDDAEQGAGPENGRGGRRGDDDEEPTTGPDDGSRAGQVGNYTGDFRKDLETFYKSPMDKPNAEAFIAAQSLEGKDINALMDLQTQISRIMSVLNGNQRVPDSVGEPNGGEIVNRPEAVEVFRTFKDETIMNAIRNPDDSAADSANADDPEAVSGGPDDGTRGEQEPSAQSTFDAEAAKKQLQDAPGMINDDEDAVEEVFKDQIKSKEDVIALVRIYPEVWEDLYGFLNDREMTRYVRRHISKYGIEVPPKGTAPDRDMFSQGAEDDVEAGVQGGGVAPPETGDTPQQGDNDTSGGAVGQTPSGADEPVSMPKLQQMPIETPEDSAEFLRSLPPEVIDSLPPEVKAEVEKFQGTGQSDKPVQPIGRVSSSRPNDPETGATVRPGDETNALDALASDRARTADF